MRLSTMFTINKHMIVDYSVRWHADITTQPRKPFEFLNFANVFAMLNDSFSLPMLLERRKTVKNPNEVGATLAEDNRINSCVRFHLKKL